MAELYLAGPDGPDASAALPAPDPLDDPVVLITPENVRIVYALAGLGSRGLAFLVDLGIRYGTVLLVLLVATALTRARLFIAIEWSGFLVAIVLVSFFLAQNAYAIVFELLWSGQTPGKRLLGIRVIQDGGYPVTALGSVIRNFLRVADLLPLAYATGLVSAFLTSRHQRLGDLAAGTVVVREPDVRAGLLALRLLAARETRGLPEWQARHGIHPSPAETEAIHRVILRMPLLEESAAAGIADRLLEEVLRARGIEGRPPDIPPARRALRELLGGASTSGAPAGGGGGAPGG